MGPWVGPVGPTLVPKLGLWCVGPRGCPGGDQIGAWEGAPSGVCRGVALLGFRGAQVGPNAGARWGPLSRLAEGTPGAQVLSQWWP